MHISIRRRLISVCVVVQVPVTAAAAAAATLRPWGPRGTERQGSAEA